MFTKVKRNVNNLCRLLRTEEQLIPQTMFVCHHDHADNVQGELEGSWMLSLLDLPSGC